VRRAVICLLAGCFTKPEPFTPPDAALVNCSAVAFPDNPSTFGEFLGTNPADPSLTADGLEMYFTIAPYPMDPYLYEIAHWTRTTPSGMFAPDPTPLAFNDAGTADSDPSLTADGSMIFFISQRSHAGERGYFATRTDGTWGPGQSIPGLETMDMHSIDISFDGLTLYFFDTSNPARLMMATRGSRLDNFGPPTIVGGDLGTDLGFHTVSADQLEMFYLNTTGTKHAARATTNDLFEPAPPTFASIGIDPDLSADGETLVVAIANTLGVLHRDCPAP